MRALAFLFVVCLVAGISNRCLADGRVALVIGNSKYQHVPSLPNPANDAGAIALLLKGAGFDTVEANEHLGYPADLRDFVLPANVLRFLGVTQVRLLTNNPQKIDALEGAGIKVVQRVNCDVDPSPDAISYLLTKKIRMGHMFPLSHSSPPFVVQESESLDDSPETQISKRQRVHALKAKVNVLQGLVCHLLAKNEYLRMRFR